jgi:ABC-type lipopolysaccharide export system ATPase subunit
MEMQKYNIIPMKFDTFAKMNLTIHTSNLVKRYKSRTVVNQVSVNLQQGEIVGLLGPNGAGKTTSFYMVVGLIKPDEGEVFLDNHQTADVQKGADGNRLFTSGSFSIQEIVRGR